MFNNKDYSTKLLGLQGVIIENIEENNGTIEVSVSYNSKPLPPVLLIDEFRGNADGEKFQCILMDGETKEIMDILSEEEKNIVRRGRNTENHHIPKNSSVEEYAYSTAFEALIGYLYLTKNINRVKEVIEVVINNINSVEK